MQKGECFCNVASISQHCLYSLCISEKDVVIRRILVCHGGPMRIHRKEALKENCEVAEAIDCRKASKMVTGGIFNCVIMDVKMPKVYGLEAIERIRKRDNNIPIIMCRTKDDVVVKASNVAAFMVKPTSVNVVEPRIFEFNGG